MPVPADGRPGVAALAGGVGAARFLRGLVEVVPAASVTVVGNTGDDQRFHGLHVSPDLDTVTYTLAGAGEPETGWGLAGETFRCMEALDRYGLPTWFRLGDADLATHLFRTARLAEGARLSEVTAEITAAWGVDVRLLPMSDVAAPTVIETVSDGRLAMQEWFVRRRAEPRVSGIDLSAAAAASPAPGVLEALEAAEVIVISPSNPLISIAPILAVDRVREALVRRRDRVVAVSPIVGGAAVKGPADRLLRDQGIEVSARGVAETYADVCGTFVLDDVDAELADKIEALGVTPVVAPTIMHDVAAASALAAICLEAVRG